MARITKDEKRGRPYIYSSTVILRCFIVRLWFRMDSNNALHEFLGMNYVYNKKIMKACGLTPQLTSILRVTENIFVP